MSAAASKWASRAIVPHRSAKQLLAALAARANPYGLCILKYREIIQDTMMSTSTIKRHLKTLVELGMITVEGQKNSDGGYGANLYRLMLDRDFSANPKRKLPMALDEDEYARARMHGRERRVRERGGELTDEQVQELNDTELYRKSWEARLKERRASKD